MSDVDIPALVERVREEDAIRRAMPVVDIVAMHIAEKELAAAAPVLADEVERLREALRLYGRHLVNCGLHGHYAMIGEPYECNCGLKQLQETR